MKTSVEVFTQRNLWKISNWLNKRSRQDRIKKPSALRRAFLFSPILIGG